jgi:hypothetical protein
MDAEQLNDFQKQVVNRTIISNKKLNKFAVKQSISFKGFSFIVV